jgi:outer membrane protein TolC
MDGSACLSDDPGLARPSLGAGDVLLLCFRGRAAALAGLAVLTTAAGGAAPAAAKAVALNEAIALAVRGNPGLAAAGAEVRIAAAAAVAARGADDFVLDLTANWLENRRDIVPGRGLQAASSDEVTGTLGLTKPLPTGGRLGLRLVSEFSRVRLVDAGTADSTADPMQVGMVGSRRAVDEYVPSLQLAFQHPVLRGFGVDVARADRRRARTRGDIATAQREATAAQLLRDVIVAYWDLAYATQELEIRRAAAAAAREQLLRVQANIDVGKQPRSASAEIIVEIALRDDAVLLSEQARLERALELGRLCGMQAAAREARALVAADAPSPSARVPDEASALAAALAQNPALLTVRAQGRGAAIEVDVTDNGLLPQLDVAASGGPLGNASTFDSAFREFRGLGNYVVTAGLVFQLPIGRHAARGAHEAARETLHKVRLNETELTQQITAAVVRWVSAADAARRRTEVLARSTEAAAVDLEAERARFEVGRSTNFDVLRRQNNLASVQLVHLRARVDHLRSLAAVEALTGDILDNNGVRLK